MIKNIPSSTEFEVLGIQCISQSFEMLFALSEHYKDSTENDEVVKEEVPESEFWKYNKITISTSLIVLFQGVEYLMKMSIAKHSALLLLENNRNEWPTLPTRQDKNFDELQTISGENLLSVFCATAPKGFDLTDFVKNYELLRVNRNKLVHSTGVKKLSHVFVLQQILFFLSTFYSNYTWIDILRDKFKSEPFFGYWDHDIEEAYFFKVLDFFERELGKSGLKQYFPYSLKARRYLCPDCTYWLNSKYDGPKPKWSFLKPNSPSSKIVQCLICTKEYDVVRQDCPNENCKGNVLNNDRIQDLCLTCFDED